MRVISGRIYDVAVDMRADSPSFGQSVGLELDAADHSMLWIPPGFAHGFYVLSETADFVYKCTNYYSPEHEVSLRWDDPELGINWPLIDGQQPTLSKKDRDAKNFAEAPRL